MMGNEGINKLAGVLQGRMRDMGDKPQVLDFGTIQPDMSLLTNRFPKPVPQEDYVVCRQLTYNSAKPLTMSWWADEAKSPVAGWEDENWRKKDGWQKSDTDKHKAPDVIPPHRHGTKGEHYHSEDPDGKHYHDIYVPDKMRWLRPGDRVPVAWVGDDPVVVDLIYPATVIDPP